MIRNVISVSAIFIMTAAAGAGEMMARPLKYNKAELEKSYYEFIQILDSVRIAQDYPKVVKNLLSAEPEKQSIALKTLGQANDINAIPWVVVFLDSDNREVKTYAGCALEQIVSFDALKRRDKNFLGGIAIKPLGRGDIDLRPLAWIVLRMMRSEDTILQGYAAIMAGYLGLDYFEDELRILEKSDQPAVSDSAKEALKILANSKEKPQKRVLPYEETDVNEQVSRDEDYKVYSDLLMQLYPDVTQKDIFVIRQTTRDEREGLDQESAAKKYLKEKFGDELSDELIENYFKVNSKAAELQDRFGKRLNIIFVSNAQVKEIFEPRDTGWQRFYAEFPHAKGITDVSRIAYNAEKTKAFLYYTNTVSPVGGEGYYVLMVRQGDKWVIQKKDLCWIS